jgi:hypothetical protein
MAQRAGWIYPSNESLRPDLASGADEEARKRNEALRVREMALARSTLKAAWIAAGAAIVEIVVGIFTWLFPPH